MAAAASHVVAESTARPDSIGQESASGSLDGFATIVWWALGTRIFVLHSWEMGLMSTLETRQRSVTSGRDRCEERRSVERTKKAM
jgi:hypothetical protein